MLLIFFLGVTANLALVSGDCNVGTPTLHDFDYSRFSGPRLWYFLKHHSDETENNFECVRNTFTSPEGNRSLGIADVYDISKQAQRTIHGNITYWNSTGYLETSHQWTQAIGRILIIAVDYDRYFISKRCRDETHELSHYVAYRSPNPDQETVKEVHRELQEKNVDTSQLVDWSVDHCP